MHWLNSLNYNYSKPKKEEVIVGGRTLARRKGPTGTIPGNQAIEQSTNAYVNIR